MSEIDRVGTVDIAEDMAFQRRSWNVQRVGWAVMFVIVVAALAGLFGSGPLSGATAGDASTFQVRYARAIRHRDATQFRIDVPTSRTSQNQVEIAIERSFLEGINLESIIPEPESVEAGADAIVYSFDVGGAEQPVTITFNFEPVDIGPTSAIVAVNDERPITLDIFVFP